MTIHYLAALTAAAQPPLPAPPPPVEPVRLPTPAQYRSGVRVILPGGQVLRRLAPAVAVWEQGR
jgi:hypothetical protein